MSSAQLKADQELKKFKQDFEKAARHKDRPALEQMIHDDFTLVDPSGNLVDKRKLIDEIVHPDSDFMQNFSRAEHKTTIHISGDSARESADVKIKGKVAKRDYTGDWINTTTFMKGPAGWQIVGNTMTKK
jgi:ketosteroid isomerase-like protein